MAFIDPTGMDSIYFDDQSNRPQDNGTQGTSYTATVTVVQNGNIVGYYPNGGSTYPNSVSNTNNNAAANTLNEGEHQFNNASGHDSGNEQGLNIVDSEGNRVAPGTNTSGEAVQMTVVNVHEGTSNNGNFNSRGSQGCMTLNPSVSDNVLNNFDWSGAGGNTGNSTGSVFVNRSGNDANTALNHIVNRIQPIRPDVNRRNNGL